MGLHDLGRFAMAEQNPIVGTCRTMCPVTEFRFRSKHNLLHSFERARPTHQQTAKNETSDLCVKEFRRSAAGENVSDPRNLRTPETLLQTVNYLFTTILFKEGAQFNFIYDFIFDRLRSVRQDAVIQQLQIVQPMLCIGILERCVRFYVYAAYRAKLQPGLNIELHINTQHTNDCLKTLLLMYKGVGFKFRERVKLHHRLSLVAVHMLLHMQCHDTLCGLLINVPSHWWKQEPLQTVVGVIFAVFHKNYVRAVKLSQKLISEKRNIVLIAFSLSVDALRLDCVKMLCHSHSSKVSSFPAEELPHWLFLNSTSDVTELCMSLGLTCTPTNAIKFSKNDFVTKDIPSARGCNIFQAIGQLSNNEIIGILNFP
uniref:germinal-center associated nuclear protein isoform X2 n=1 Tax=Ciona intestinalis TaxID=7719 RepID=UPI00089DB45A|nr:germinal-center associated nuclear protein isoform X2 [Ciona intestinalis]|eukprot:XP_018667462.1 germinal-center associated nuclear protein isoform X2 [Ciona intestinalis]